jgi:hypothetical protein
MTFTITTRFRTRRLAKVLAFTLAPMATTACNPSARSPSDDAHPPLEVKQVGSSNFQGDAKDATLASECAKWQLTKEQARHFFQKSKTYPDSPYSEFYQLPCSIDGIIAAEGKTWEFTINAGSTAIWRSGKEVRHFGCVDSACEPLVLMMPDGMNP